MNERISLSFEYRNKPANIPLFRSVPEFREFAQGVIVPQLRALETNSYARLACAQTDPEGISIQKDLAACQLQTEYCAAIDGAVLFAGPLAGSFDFVAEADMAQTLDVIFAPYLII